MVKCTYVKVAGGKKCGSIAVNKGEVYCKNCKVLDSNRKREATRMGKLRADPDKMKEHVARKRESYRRINQVDEKNYRKEKFPFPMPLNREGSGKESKEKKRKKANQHLMALRSGDGAAGGDGLAEESADHQPNLQQDKRRIRRRLVKSREEERRAGDTLEEEVDGQTEGSTEEENNLTDSEEEDDDSDDDGDQGTLRGDRAAHESRPQSSGLLEGLGPAGDKSQTLEETSEVNN